MFFKIHPVNLLQSLSMALELSNGGMSRHHWRVAVISYHIADLLEMPGEQKQKLIYAALLHDIGAAANWTERRKLNIFQAGVHIYQHAEEGYLLLKDSPQLGQLALPIRHHHDRWDGQNPSGAAGEAIPLIGRILHLADRIDVLIQDGIPIFEQQARIMTAIHKLSGSYFDPKLVKVFGKFARRESFWLDLINPLYYAKFFHQIDGQERMRFSVDDILNIAEIFSTIIDCTSAFTARHSRSVATIAALLARIRGFSTEEIKMMRIAGLLHDLGKMIVPNEILEKPGKLTDAEFLIIKQHPYYTYRILDQIDGLTTIAQWAAYHHETLDGAGYPFRIAGSAVPLGARIVAVADVFVALSESRPYRPCGVNCAELEVTMREMVANRKLDGGIVTDLMDNCREAYDLIGDCGIATTA